MSIGLDGDQLAEAIATVVRALARADRTEADEAVAHLAFHAPDLKPKARVSERDHLAVWARDGFTCRYCSVRTIPTAVLNCLGRVYPTEFPVHPNWKTDSTHAALYRVSTSTDHLVPVSAGGAWRDHDNLVTSCWRCNARKGSFRLQDVGMELLPISETSWDGLTRSYRPLWEAAGSPPSKGFVAWLPLFEAHWANH